MPINIYGSNAEDRILDLYLGDDVEGTPVKLFPGIGTAVYRHCPTQFKRVKGINPKI